MHSKIDGWPIPCLTNVINDHYHLNLTRSVNYFTLFTLVHRTDIKTINDANVIREITFMALALHNILLVFILQSTDTKHVELMWCKRPCYVQYVTGNVETTCWYVFNNEGRCSTLQSTNIKTTTYTNGVRDNQPAPWLGLNEGVLEIDLRVDSSDSLSQTRLFPALFLTTRDTWVVVWTSVGPWNIILHLEVLTNESYF